MHVSSGDVMDLFSDACPLCGSAEVRAHSRYETQAHGPRTQGKRTRFLTKEIGCAP